MEIKNEPWYTLRGPKKVGGYLIIKNPTPEVEMLLDHMRTFKFNEGGINFRMICKRGLFEGEEGVLASVGWKIEIPDRTSTLEERVKEIQ